ncbi:MAG TPA: hypothetical protein VMF06_03350 [Candidatus Limnocylindria bacterium]|nr:hypothetical protein [Candidatus Limnocylindria bacterium]
MKKSPVKSTPAKPAAKAAKTVAKATPEDAISDTSSLTITNIGPVNPTTHAPQTSFTIGELWAVDVTFSSSKALKKVTYTLAISGAFSVVVDSKIKDVTVGSQLISFSNQVPSDAKTKKAKFTISLMVDGKTKATGKTSFEVTS